MSAGHDLAFACQCGEVTGHIEGVSPVEGDYVVCHCTDCQDLTRYLGQADAVLDPYGGSHLYQSRCARVKLAKGKNALCTLHLTEQATMRWYTVCCKTPLFNTYANGKLPYVTTQLAACDRKEVDRLLGKPLGHLFTESAPVDAHHLPSLSFAKLMRRFFVRMAKDLLAGDRRKSALFDPSTLQPIAPPHRLTAMEREQLEALRP